MSACSTSWPDADHTNQRGAAALSTFLIVVVLLLILGGGFLLKLLGLAVNVVLSIGGAALVLFIVILWLAAG
jgi:hypothetical protein